MHFDRIKLALYPFSLYPCLVSALLCQEIPLFVLLKAIGIESDAEAVLMVGKGKQFEVRVGVWFSSRTLNAACV